MCFFVLQATINSLYFAVLQCQLIQQRLLVAECRVFGDSAAEFHKLRRGIWQNLLLKNVGPGHDGRTIMIWSCARACSRRMLKSLPSVTPKLDWNFQLTVLEGSVVSE